MELAQVLAIFDSFLVGLFDFCEVANIPKRMRLFDAQSRLAVRLLLGRSTHILLHRPALLLPHQACLRIVLNTREIFRSISQIPMHFQLDSTLAFRTVYTISGISARSGCCIPRAVAKEPYK